MWIFTIYGFYSVVALTRDFNGDKPTTPTVMVRARTREHLEALLRRFTWGFGTSGPAVLFTYKTTRGPGIATFERCCDKPEILEQPASDYRWRVLVPQKFWNWMALQLTKEIDWDNFKNAADNNREDGPGGHDYIAALHAVWAHMNHVQTKDRQRRKLFDRV